MRRNWLVLVLFLIATSFFVYQHYISVGWDFASYMSNAKYWFSGGSYFEILRPPLMPLLLGLLSVASWRAAEFLFIILVSALFAYSSARLAKSIGFNAAAFYALSLNIYVLNIGLINGTELLSLAFLELSICFLIENKSSSGVFLGLSSLARYTSLALFPLLLLHLNWRKILNALLLFSASLIPWFIYNYYAYGNFFMSIADQFANNILYRGYLDAPMKISDFLIVQNVLVPFFILGLIIIIIRIIRVVKSKSPKASRNSGKNSRWQLFLAKVSILKIEIVMIFLLLYAVNSYANIPVKNARYLFNLVLPTLYFAYVGLSFIVVKIMNIYTQKSNKSSVNSANLLWIKRAFIIIAVLGVALMFIFAAILSSIDFDPPAPYHSAKNQLDKLNLSDCNVQSNSWTKLNYYGVPASPYPRQEMLNESVNSGNLIILFKYEPEPDYVFNKTFMNDLPYLYDDEIFSIIGTGECNPSSKYNKSYLQQVDEAYSFESGEHINYNPCIIIFHSVPLFEKTCNFVNFNGFNLDENRAYI